MTRRALALLVAALTLLGCARPKTDPDASLSPRRAPHVSTDALFEDEIATANVATAYEAVNRLRPLLLDQSRVVRGIEGRTVFLDGVLVGGLEQLHSIPAAQVHEIRVLSGIEASGRFGNAAQGGAILVITKLGPRAR